MFVKILQQMHNKDAQGQQYINFWAPLKKRLSKNLQEDLRRIYSESLYCDWVLKFEGRTLKLNRCILITRAYRFYNLLVTLFHEGSSPTKLQIDCICRFLKKVYYENNIEQAESAVLNELESLQLQTNVGTPESEGFITAASSPSDCNKPEFYDASESLETTAPAGDIYLEKELEEQDHLSSLFHSISIKTKHTKTTSEKSTHNVKNNNNDNTPPLQIKKNTVLKRLHITVLRDMDSGLETASSDTSGMDLSDPMQNSFNLDELSSKEQRIINEHDSSSSETTDDFEDLGKNVRNEIAVMQTKEQKQKQNEEIVIMESSSVSSETGSWESVFPRGSTFNKQYSPCDSSSDVNVLLAREKSTVNTSNGHGNYYFIDASSLRDESELCAITSSIPSSTNDTLKSSSSNKLTKLKVSESVDCQKNDVAEFHKELKVFDSVTTQPNITKPEVSYASISSDCASTSNVANPVILNNTTIALSHSSDDLKPNNGLISDLDKIKLVIQDTECKSQSEDSSSDDVNNAEHVCKHIEDKYLTDICNSNVENVSTSGQSVAALLSNDITSEVTETVLTQNVDIVSDVCGEVRRETETGCAVDEVVNSDVIKSQSSFETDDTQKPNFIRSNTFELEPNDDHIALLRQSNERRQGSLLFQSSIQHYSGHNLGMDVDMPATPHNSIIQISDTLIIDQSGDRPLDSLFYDKVSPKMPVVQLETCEPEPKISEEDDDDDIEIIQLPCKKTMKRDESVPIISGGVSTQDYKPEVRTDSPLSRRKLESTPIVSGGAILIDEPEEKIEKPPKPVVTAAWVVDMKSDDTKIEPPKEILVEQEKMLPVPPKPNHKSSLGFYVDLTKIPTETKEEEPRKPVENSSESSDTASDKKNIFSMFIDFDPPKKSMPSRLSQSLYCKKPDKPSTSQASELQMSQSITSLEAEKSSDVKKVEDETKEKSVYMFIESETTVVRRKRSSSNNRAHNRHSWNSSGDSDTSTLCHQRTYSLSGEGSFDLPCIKPIIFDTETKERKIIETSNSSDENKDTSSMTENEDQVGDLKKMEVIDEVKEIPSSGFVRLSDLDKPVPKIVTTEIEQPVATRMSRSIPETSWIENKLLMSRSTGCRTSSSRLFPQLSSSTPFLTQQTRTKSPGQDTDELVSELSDFSSMHSSTALEGSTEETSHSSSYQPHHSADRLGHDLLRMFLEEISPDVTVEVGGRRLKAHKCILSSRCQYFAAMLSGGWVESAGNVISLQGFSYQAVHFAMCHIYSGAADIPETISLVELATLADMLGLEGLKEVVAYTLKLKHCHMFHKPCSVCVVGVLECLPLAAAYGLDELYRKALRWITRYFVRVWPTRAFAMLPRELMEKCYQQHVVHMSADNVLETTLCCDKLLATLPSVRWAEIVHELTSQLADACQHYVIQHFSSVLASASFLTLGKELSWNISRLEDGLMRAAERLAPEQSCRSYSRAHRLLALLDSGEDCWSPNFVELVRKLLNRVEDCVVRQAVRVSYTSAWPRLDTALRARVQDLCCLPLDRPRVSRQPRSTSGSRNLDLRQVRLAMQQHTRRTQSSDSRPAMTRSVRVPVKPAVPEPPRPRTWPAQVTTKSKIISSSESSRTSSPAMKRTMKKGPQPVRSTVKDADMSLDSLASPVNSKTRMAANKAKHENKDLLILAKDKRGFKSKVEPTIKPKVNRSTVTQTKTKSTNNILKSNVQKPSTEKTSLSKSMPAMNKENRTIVCKQQSKSGSSSSTQHSPSALLRNRPTNTSSPSSQPRTNMSPYNGSPSLRRSLLLAARAPQTPVKPVSPATNKRLARVQAASQSVTSPTKSSAAKCVAGVGGTRAKTVPQRSVSKVTVKRQTERATVERSGTFLKDEPTVLNKTE
ncbi:uncharacterized protein CBL_03382 [Carabus blaptoides fortunei]